ncbi:rhodanese-like domain-containing protein [Geobacter argillaceus]|uniref:Rhodanese-related sulfurtransferase n=1 Tax=Geobacter argillaceus TaxID=345631 RepID=A0A562VJH2_9BACT|nr:rhodanese-like domain-containing protein [Geobacter argillaceus]TWJ18018.1 rhodanese-related sulfurtransferase [Geobacter argillaceus]
MRMVAVIFLFLLCVVGVASASPAHNVTSGDVKIMLNKDKKIFLLDVRTVEEFRQARLRGATLIPIGEIERRYFEVPKDRPVVVYCAVGSRSGPVADFLEKKGYRQVYNMKDGIVGWYRSGYPIER